MRGEETGPGALPPSPGMRNGPSPTPWATGVVFDQYRSEARRSHQEAIGAQANFHHYYKKHMTLMGLRHRIESSDTDSEVDGNTSSVFPRRPFQAKRQQHKPQRQPAAPQAAIGAGAMAGAEGRGGAGVGGSGGRRRSLPTRVGLQHLIIMEDRPAEIARLQAVTREGCASLGSRLGPSRVPRLGKRVHISQSAPDDAASTREEAAAAQKRRTSVGQHHRAFALQPPTETSLPGPWYDREDICRLARDARRRAGPGPPPAPGARSTKYQPRNNAEYRATLPDANVKSLGRRAGGAPRATTPAVSASALRLLRTPPTSQTPDIEAPAQRREEIPGLAKARVISQATLDKINASVERQRQEHAESMRRHLGVMAHSPAH